MRFRTASLAACLLLPTSPAAADWLDLKDGTSLRGFDFKQVQPRGKVKRSAFTLENGQVVHLDSELVTEVRKSPPGETVELNGRQVTLREKVRLLREEDARRKRDAVRDIERWARGGKDADAARERIASLAAEDRERFLTAALGESKVGAARSLAARELASHKTKRSMANLSWAAVTDRQGAVREASLDSLRTLNEPSTGDQFIPFLKSPSSDQRTFAAAALEQFPSRNAVPVLIDTVRLYAADFGRGFIFRGETRSYIGDYNLVSGGTGSSIIEVADPEIRTMQTGVVLDVKVNKVEIELETRVRALRKITGQDFGRDMPKWREWWKSSEEKPAGKE